MPSSARSDLEYDTDVVGSRALAQVIDIVLAGCLFVAAGLAVRSLAGVDARTALLASSPVLIAYGTLLEGFWNGQTIGKRVAGIEVRTSDGTEIRPIQALLRNVPAALLPGLPVYFVALLSIATSDRRQRVFDHVADTIVVRSY